MLASGGFTAESGRLMQLLIDLHNLCATVDQARDDHLCEERGERFTQEALRESLLSPIRAVWATYSRTWFAGTRVESESERRLFDGANKSRRRR